MHRPPFPLRATAGLSEQFSHALVHPHSHGQGVPVIAIGGDDVIVCPHQGYRSDRHGFLPDVKMQKTAHLVLLVLAEGEVFETPDSHHRAVEADFVLRAQATVHRRAGEVHHGEGGIGGRVLHELRV